MRDNWESISAFCKTGTGATPSRSNPHYFRGEIPWVKSGELRDGAIDATEEHVNPTALVECRLKLLPINTILIALYGATVGRVAILQTPATTNQAVCHLIPDVNKADTQYLFYALRAKLPEFITQRVGGAQPNISQEIVKDTKIFLPPLVEQKRIAAILCKADAIRRKRAEAIRLADEFLKALFLDMFGDPPTNPKGWPQCTIRDMLSEVRYGCNKKAGTTGNYPMLRMGNITYEGNWDFSSLKHIHLSKDEETKYLVFKDDILFNRTNSKELVGKTAVYQKEKPMAYAGYLVRARTNENSNPEYISAFINSNYGKSVLRHMCKNIVGMANINAQEFQNITILNPPLSQQNIFADIVYKCRAYKTKLNQGRHTSNLLFSSLVQQAFRGDL